MRASPLVVVTVISLFALLGVGCGAHFYVATDAVTDGNGSREKPWSLAAAEAKERWGDQ